MHQIVELNEEGGLYLPSEVLARLLAEAKPHTRYALQAQGENLVLMRLHQGQPSWSTANPEERAKAFHDWATRHKEGPNLPDHVLSRETIYD